MTTDNFRQATHKPNLYELKLSKTEAAAKAGDPLAQNDLGFVYASGDGVLQDYAKAAFWYRKAAEQGYAVSQSNLAHLYYRGEGVPQDYLQAAVWCRKAAEQGHLRAEFNLGVLYEHGQGVPLDYAQAAIWYRKAADKGYAAPQTCLGTFYYEGKGVPQDYAESANWFRKAARQGVILAQHNLAAAYAGGIGVQRDHGLAAVWFRKAADQGYTDAQLTLGEYYASGKGVPQNYREAAVWYRKAAEQGDADAQFLLGVLYLDENEVRDNAEGLRWCRMAADQGHELAQSKLRGVYAEGRGEPDDNIPSKQKPTGELVNSSGTGKRHQLPGELRPPTILSKTITSTGHVMYNVSHRPGATIYEQLQGSVGPPAKEGFTFNPKSYDSTDPIGPRSTAQRFMFIPHELEIETRPELRNLPSNILFAEVGTNAGVPVLRSALYEPDLSSLHFSGNQYSLTYKNKHAGDGLVRITHDADRQKWEGEKSVGGKIVGVAFGDDWKRFFTHLTLLGLAKGEGCVMESVSERSSSSDGRPPHPH